MAQEMSEFRIFIVVFVHIEYTSNMAACYGNDVSDLTAPYVHSFSGASHHIKYIQ